MAVTVSLNKSRSVVVGVASALLCIFLVEIIYSRRGDLIQTTGHDVSTNELNAQVFFDENAKPDAVVVVPEPPQKPTENDSAHSDKQAIKPTSEQRKNDIASNVVVKSIKEPIGGQTDVGLTSESDKLPAGTDEGKHVAAAGEFKFVREPNVLFKNLTLQNADEMVYRHVTTMTGKCARQQRFGKAGDGGYTVCMDPPIAPVKHNCLVYSFGIRNEWSFDDAIAGQLGCEVHSFDPSMKRQDQMHSDRVRFHNLGIWGSDIVNKDGWNLMSLGTIIKFLGHEKRVIDYLKIDVEGAEWPALQEMLKNNSTFTVKQMIFEIHTPKFKESSMTVADFGQVYTDLTALQTQLGFRLYMEKHTNGCCGRFASLTAQRRVTHVSHHCCYELFYINSLFQL